jgi:hypothetical protein
MAYLQYYVMENTRVGFDSLCDGVSNEHGVYLDQALNDESVEHAYAVKRRKRPLGDWIATTGGWLALTERATKLFRQFAICERIRWVPLTVVDRQKKPLLEGTLLYGPKQWDVLDLLKSEYEFIPNTDVICHITKWVLRHNDVPPLDAFYTDKFRWISSARLRDAIIKEGLTGFEFIGEGAKIERWPPKR